MNPREKKKNRGVEQHEAAERHRLANTKEFGKGDQQKSGWGGAQAGPSVGGPSVSRPEQMGRGMGKKKGRRTGNLSTSAYSTACPNTGPHAGRKLNLQKKGDQKKSENEKPAIKIRRPSVVATTHNNKP